MRKIFSIIIPVVIIICSIYMIILYDKNNNKYENRTILRSYVQNGKYYIIDHSKKVIEVSKEEWIFIKYITPIYYVTYFLMLLTISYINYKFIVPYFLYNKSPTAAFEVSQMVKSSGAPLISFSCGGKIGESSYSNPFLKVKLYSKGFWIKPVVIINPFGILFDDIISIKQEEKNNKKIIIINHRSKVTKNPIVLYDNISSANMQKMVSLIYKDKRFST